MGKFFKMTYVYMGKFFKISPNLYREQNLKIGGQLQQSHNSTIFAQATIFTHATHIPVEDF